MPSARLPRFSPFLDRDHLEGVLSTKPRWLTTPFSPPDDSEGGETNDKRGIIDLLVFGVDNEIHRDDTAALIQRGWSVEMERWEIRSQELDVTVYRHPCNGAQVVTYEETKGKKGNTVAGLTAVRFCPARVIFGRNDRVADVRQERLTELIYAYTEHLLPATTRRAWQGPAWRTHQDDEEGRKSRNRRFLLWTMRRIDLCIQAQVKSVSAAFRVARLAKWTRTKSAPLLWLGDAVRDGALTGKETGLTFGVPPDRNKSGHTTNHSEAHTSETWDGVVDIDTADGNDQNRDKEADGQRKRQGRMSLTLYDKGRQQHSDDGWRTFKGKACPVDRVLRCEFSYRGLDGCAALIQSLSLFENVDHPSSPVILRIPKADVPVDEQQHGAWVDLTYPALHRAVQFEVLGLQKSRLRVTKSKGYEHRRSYDEGWFDELSDDERRLIWNLAAGKRSPYGKDITEVQRRQAMELAMTSPELANGPCNLYWTLWRRKGQHLSAGDYQAAWTRKRKWKPGEAAQELELAKGERGAIR